MNIRTLHGIWKAYTKANADYKIALINHDYDEALEAGRKLDALRGLMDAGLEILEENDD